MRRFYPKSMRLDQFLHQKLACSMKSFYPLKRDTDTIYQSVTTIVPSMSFCPDFIVILVSRFYPNF